MGNYFKYYDRYFIRFKTINKKTSRILKQFEIERQFTLLQQQK